MGYLSSIECERAQRTLSVALDGELSQFERAYALGHLASCEPCQAFQVRLVDITTALRSTPLEQLPTPVRVPVARVSRRLVGRLASAGAAAAVVFLGLATAPDRSNWQSDGALIGSALHRPATTNDLLIDVIRPTIAARRHGAIAYGEGGIGAYKPPLAPGV